MKLTLTPRVILFLAIVYFIFPFDLLPDILGPFGRVDDLAVLCFALWKALGASSSKGGARRHQAQKQNATTTDPYSVFKLSPNSSRDEIEARYKELVKDYHPDRVAHLGEDLRKVAHEKMIEIQQAYSVLAPK